VVFFVIFYLKKLTTQKIPPNGLMPLPEPPGKMPLIGHALVAAYELHLKCFEWQKTLGDIFMLHVGKRTVIILNSQKHVSELLQKRGVKYSSRSHSFLFWETFGRKHDYIAAPYNKWFKKIMPLVHGLFSQQKIEDYLDFIYECRYELLKILAEDSLSETNGFFPRDQFHYTTLNVILNIVFGTRTKGMTDPLYKKSCRNRWLHKRANDTASEFESVMGIFLEKVKNSDYGRDEDGKMMGDSCLAKDLLKQVDKGVISELEETTAATLTALIAAVSNDAEIQARAHDELDRVVGSSRLPTYNDLASLPYIRAITKEVLRWAPPLVMGIPHVIEEDDEYMGYHIPKNSIVAMNMYALNWNPSRFSNPSKFDPDRYLGVKESAATLAQGVSENRDQFSFGAGRRLCLGTRLAEAELELFSASILWAFRIERPSTELKPIDLTSFVQFGIAQWIKPFN
ncbi:11854_t:CDS:2, partial [Ambispora leptoticha]